MSAHDPVAELEALAASLLGNCQRRRIPGLVGDPVPPRPGPDLDEIELDDTDL